MNNQSRKRDLPNPDDAMAKGEKKEPKNGDPESGEKNRNKPDSTGKPPSSETGDPSRTEEPSWWTELPEETRSAILSRRVEDLPPKFRELLQRYEKWLLTKPRKRQP